MSTIQPDARTYAAVKVSPHHRAIHLVVRGKARALCGAYIDKPTPPEVGDRECENCQKVLNPRGRDRQSRRNPWASPPLV